MLGMSGLKEQGRTGSKNRSDLLFCLWWFWFKRQGATFSSLTHQCTLAKSVGVNLVKVKSSELGRLSWLWKRDNIICWHGLGWLESKHMPVLHICFNLQLTKGDRNPHPKPDALQHQCCVMRRLTLKALLPWKLLSRDLSMALPSRWQELPGSVLALWDRHVPAALQNLVGARPRCHEHPPYLMCSPWHITLGFSALLACFSHLLLQLRGSHWNLLWNQHGELKLAARN